MKFTNLIKKAMGIVEDTRPQCSECGARNGDPLYDEDGVHWGNVGVLTLPTQDGGVISICLKCSFTVPGARIDRRRNGSGKLKKTDKKQVEKPAPDAKQNRLI